MLPRSISRLVLLGALVCAHQASSGCATIVGTAVSPVTGGVDLTRYYSDDGGSPLFVPFVFVAGGIGGPFVALWNGLRQDTGYVGSRSGYWQGLPQVFRPYEMVDRELYVARQAREHKGTSESRSTITD